MLRIIPRYAFDFANLRKYIGNFKEKELDL